jgi:hypothetical protein
MELQPSTCQARKKNGEFCKRSVTEGEEFCWQHATSLAHRVKSLTRNQWTGILGILLTLVFGLLAVHYSNTKEEIAKEVVKALPPAPRQHDVEKSPTETRQTVPEVSVTTQEKKSEPKKQRPPVQLETHGSKGSNVGSITQGPGSIAQIGTVGSTATVYNAPPARTLTTDQYSNLVKLLRQAGAFKIIIRHAEHNFEAQQYYDSFDKALKEAGWDVTDEESRIVQMAQETRQGQGLQILVHDVNKAPTAAVMLQKSLKEVGVDALGIPVRDFSDEGFVFYVGVQ